MSEKPDFLQLPQYNYISFPDPSYPWTPLPPEDLSSLPPLMLLSPYANETVHGSCLRQKIVYNNYTYEVIETPGALKIFDTSSKVNGLLYTGPATCKNKDGSIHSDGLDFLTIFPQVDQRDYQWLDDLKGPMAIELRTKIAKVNIPYHFYDEDSIHVDVQQLLAIFRLNAPNYRKLVRRKIVKLEDGSIIGVLNQIVYKTLDPDKIILQLNSAKELMKKGDATKAEVTARSVVNPQLRIFKLT